MDFGGSITAFFASPLIAGFISVAVVAILNFLWTVYLSIVSVPSQFDASKLPRILDTLVIRKLFPLLLLGTASFLVNDNIVSTGLVATYAGGVATALAAEVQQLYATFRGQSPIQVAQLDFAAEQAGGPDDPPIDPAA